MRGRAPRPDAAPSARPAAPPTLPAGAGRGAGAWGRGWGAGKRVLVTGAGGSIGAELCRQLYKLGPAQLIMLDRDESALHAVQLALQGRALLDSEETVLADIRDRRRVGEVFARFRPDIVFHAAA